jgi:LuxR family maltose regulon positive regulatory protein
VLRYLPTPLSAQEIAGELYVSPNTVKTHMRNLYSPSSARTAGPRGAARAIGLLAAS